MRRSARHALLAYAMLRGRPYHALERHRPETNPVKHGYETRWVALRKGIEANLKRFGGMALVPQIDDWMSGKE